MTERYSVRTLRSMATVNKYFSLDQNHKTWWHNAPLTPSNSSCSGMEGSSPAKEEQKHSLSDSPWWGRSWSPPVWGPQHPLVAPSWPRCGCRSCRSRTHSPTLENTAQPCQKLKVTAYPGINSKSESLWASSPAWDIWHQRTMHYSFNPLR